ncbi:unnamed protein product [Orchesella dallaii]|uniref:Uncharacterized protein n=1 Tax=Orchesella dallaii TaxID=48710 RepID=A0ABP1RAN8_9HEXA
MNYTKTTQATAARKAEARAIVTNEKKPPVRHTSAVMVVEDVTKLKLSELHIHKTTTYPIMKSQPTGKGTSTSMKLVAASTSERISQIIKLEQKVVASTSPAVKTGPVNMKAARHQQKSNTTSLKAAAPAGKNKK